MKKALLTLVAAAAALSAVAIVPPGLKVQRTPGNNAMFTEYTGERNIEVGPAAMRTPSRAEAGEMDYELSYEPYTALSFSGQYAGLTIGEAFEFTAEEATKYANNDLTTIFYYAGINGQSGTNQITAGTVFLTYDLQEEPFYTQSFQGASTTAWDKISIDLDTPYTIEAGKGFYVGVYYSLSSENDYSVVIDYSMHTGDEGGWVGTGEPGSTASALSWQNIAAGYGFVCLGARLHGENLPTNMADILDYQAVPIAETNSEFAFYALVQNVASNEINSLEFTIKVGDNEAKVYTAEGLTDFGYKNYVIIGAEDLSYATASKTPVDVVCTITKVNGVENGGTAATVSTPVTIIPAGTGYTRNVVIEEATGVWCGYCPIGIVTMEKIRENYPDGELIPVTVHGPSANDDPMYSSTYSRVYSLVSGGGVPAAMLNRQYSVYPEYEDVIEQFEYMQSYPAIATISATAAFTDDTKAKVQIDSKFAFTFNDDSSRSTYRLAFGVTEDGVGPYTQANYYSGSRYDYGGWETKPEEVETIYNDVARQLNSFAGILNSIPGTIVAGQEYEHSYTLTLSGITNKDNINIIVYIMNTSTGEVENACTIKTRDIEGGVADMIVDTNDAPVEYFNLQGIRVANPAEGQIYIRRQGTQATKVLF